MPARCLPAIDSILSEEDCRLQIVVDTCCGVGTPLYMPIALKILHAMLDQSKNCGSWGRVTVLYVNAIETV